MTQKYFHKIERHNTSEIISFLPLSSTTDPQFARYHPKEKLALLIPVYSNGKLTGYHGTRASDIAWASMQKQRWNGRMDIGMITEEVQCCCTKCGNKHNHTKQFLIFPGPNGTIVGNIDKLTPEEKKWCMEESKKCWENPILRPFIKT